ncbi:MAG: hypothetical protein H6R04_1059 [Burkholderiaceae bacterium]|nr:hypothetical protein [Burkholderiaceae bacterium]
MRYKNASEVIDAVQWFKEGDHPEVIRILITPEGTVGQDSIIYDAWEASIGGPLVTLVHAVETADGLMPVSAGDYIITHASGEMVPCKPDVFEQMWQPA